MAKIYTACPQALKLLGLSCNIQSRQTRGVCSSECGGEENIGIDIVRRAFGRA